jgi:hypothetical protein
MRGGFAPGVAEQLRFYVYLLIDPRDEEIFYVGKGTGERCFAHLAEARKTRADRVADYEKLARIRAIEAAGLRVGIDILRHQLDEHEALLLESAAIDLLGGKTLANRVAGHDAAELGRMSVADVNARYGATPVEIDPAHRVVLIRLNVSFERSMGDTKLYDATRRWWRVSARACKLGSPHAPDWAMAVSNGVVRAVYRIEGWEQADDVSIADDPKRPGRWGFYGQRDHAMEILYLHRDVSRYLRSVAGVPSQNPIRYVGCTG